ncbi:MAG: ATP-dependent helicase HrpB, partial [Gammaproteobacteria bacterium]|nr:ATP-dependent helicase HrpB [Gammaproteobacteria bacterium]
GALDGAAEGTAPSITALGRRMLGLGTHPRLAAMLLAPHDPDERALACDLAALLEARDPLQPSAGRPRSDALAERWQALAALRGGRAPQQANRSALAAIDIAARQWRRRLRLDIAPPPHASAHLLGDLLAHAFPDRIARQHPGDPRRYQLANGRMARIFDDSALYGEPWLVASELRSLRQAQGDRSDVLLLRAAPLDPARLQRDFAGRFTQTDTVHWDAGRRALVARREHRFDAIVLDSRPAGGVDPAQAAQALIDAVRELGLDLLPWSDSLTQWRARACCLRQWLPELSLPDLCDVALLATLDVWLAPAFAGKTRLDALGAGALAAALQGLMDWNARQRIEQLAPSRIAVPSGMERRIDYACDAHGAAVAPVLAVKLQELFGLTDTPRIAEGRIPLTLHLLSPAGRPLQVTRDLRGFWERTYPEVRKEMKGRYPKHPWPDDPWTAVASHRARPRS